MELDDFDRRLLDAIQEDGRRTGGALAAHCTGPRF
jgi:DNA-binding Lrp family transcriptional regulator